MSRVIPLALLALIVTGCGVQRPLIRPKEIPAFEEEQRKKKQKIEEERIESETEAATRKASATTNSKPTEPTK